MVLLCKSHTKVLALCADAGVHKFILLFNKNKILFLNLPKTPSGFVNRENRLLLALARDTRNFGLILQS